MRLPLGPGCRFAAPGMWFSFARTSHQHAKSITNGPLRRFALSNTSLNCSMVAARAASTPMPARRAAPSRGRGCRGRSCRARCGRDWRRHWRVRRAGSRICGSTGSTVVTSSFSRAWVHRPCTVYMRRAVGLQVDHPPAGRADRGTGRERDAVADRAAGQLQPVMRRRAVGRREEAAAEGHGSRRSRSHPRASARPAVCARPPAWRAARRAAGAVAPAARRAARPSASADAPAPRRGRASARARTCTVASVGATARGLPG